MTTRLWVRIPNLSKYKPNQVPLKIGEETYGEVLKILKEAPGNQYEVEALIYPHKRDEFIRKMANLS